MAHYVSVVAGDEGEARRIAHDAGVATLHRCVHVEKAQEVEEGDTFLFETPDDVTAHDDYDDDVLGDHWIDAPGLTAGLPPFVAGPSPDTPLLII